MDPTTESVMKRHGILAKCALVAVGLSISSAFSGCQTTIGGQTLPSAHYLKDDVQFFPAGPEFLLPEQVRVLEEYKAQRADLAGDLGSN